LIKLVLSSLFQTEAQPANAIPAKCNFLEKGLIFESVMSEEGFTEQRYARERKIFNDFQTRKLDI